MCFLVNRSMIIIWTLMDTSETEPLNPDFSQENHFNNSNVMVSVFHFHFDIRFCKDGENAAGGILRCSCSFPYPFQLRKTTSCFQPRALKSKMRRRIKRIERLESQGRDQAGVNFFD